MADEETDKEEERASSGPSAIGNRTMQVDALVEEVSGDIDVPNDVLAQVLPDPGVPQVSKPPPLPPERVGKGTIIAGVLIVVLAAGGGIIFGMKFLGEPEPVPGPDEEGEAVIAAPTPEAEEEEATDEEPEFVPIQLDEVVVSSDEEIPEDEVIVEEEIEETAPEE